MNIMSNLYPLPAFHFKVVIGANLIGADTSFQEVTGIGPEIETEDIHEGGENRYMHHLPKSIKHPKLVLKRGIAKKNSSLVKWCIKILEEFDTPFEPKLIHVFLLNAHRIPIRAWSFANAYPVKWEVESFNSTKNEVAIEKIELSYSSSNRIA